VPSKDERAALDEFTDRYGIGTAAVLDEIEQRVIGGVWGANGFTTRAQADDLAERLELSAEDRLLDIGAGRGWPGLYLAKRTGCEVVLADMPLEGLAIARARAERERLRLLACVSASARDLPFRHESFDAIVHTDVLC
jgi:2-polyprenyl-3-methyl-5-hydroxy-6-metoxy-1,4-benzoquinol methylase